MKLYLPTHLLNLRIGLWWRHRPHRYHRRGDTRFILDVAGGIDLALEPESPLVTLYVVSGGDPVSSEFGAIFRANVASGQASTLYVFPGPPNQGGGINSPSGYTVSATTEGTTLVTPNGTFNGAEIKINDLAGTFVTGTLNDQIVTLLHELGHAVNFIYGNGTSQIVNDGTALGKAGVQASIDNTALVKKNCLPVK